MYSDGEVILIDKPAGMTSFGVVARVRHMLSQQVGRKVKVGHTGTLDPFATGLMILVVGKECKNAMRYTKLDKMYEAEIILGKVSTTGDPEGEISGYDSETTMPSLAQVQMVLAQFIGHITQRPPLFSAIKINGQRAYKLARDGQEVEIPERTVTIYSLELIECAYPSLRIRTHVSSGTYIRSLAADIGAALGTGAYCRSLRRTEIAQYKVEDAVSLRDLGISS